MKINLSRKLVVSLAALAASAGPGCQSEEPVEPVGIEPGAEAGLVEDEPVGGGPAVGAPGPYDVVPAGGLEPRTGADQAGAPDQAGRTRRPAGTRPAEQPFTRSGQRAGTDLQQSVGTVQGAVRSLDYDAGRLVLDTGAGEVRLHARPLDMATLNPGDVVSVAYASYDGNLWVTPGDEARALDSFAVNGTVTGMVSSVDKATGRFGIRGQTLRAHPEDMEQLVPGQFVQVDYARVAGTDWVDRVSPTTRSQDRQGIRKASANRRP